jgi:uncharacterized protein (DUF58 family)
MTGTTEPARAWLAGTESPHLQLTRRGRVLVGFVAVVVALGWWYSPRQLNAVATPAIAALLAGVVSVWRADCETVEVSDPPPGVPGETRTVAVDIDGSGLVTVGFDVPEGLEPVDEGGQTGRRLERTVTLPARIEWSLTVTERGIYELDPISMRVHGPLGLVERRLDSEAGPELVAYPRRFELTQPAAASGQLHARHDVARQEFDRVREYQPGDPLRRVDWKTSAKRDDLHVVAFADRAGQQSVTIAGVAASGNADMMARTVATLAESTLEQGLDVGVVVPAGRCEPDSGPAHREKLLRLLARTGPSTGADGYTVVPSDVTEHEGDILVDAGDPRIKRGPRETRIRTAYSSYPLGELRAEHDDPDGTASRAQNGVETEEAGA